MTEPAQTPVTGQPEGPPPTSDELNALTKAQLEESYGLPSSLSKAEMVSAVLERFGVPEPRSGEVVLAVNGLTSDEHTYELGKPPITRLGTAVPASEAAQIIAQADRQGVHIREVN